MHEFFRTLRWPLHLTLLLFSLNSISALGACCIDVNSGSSSSKQENLPPCHAVDSNQIVKAEQSDSIHVDSQKSDLLSDAISMNGECCPACIALQLTVVLGKDSEKVPSQSFLSASADFISRKIDPLFKPPITHLG